MAKKKRILFLCTGNAVRSQMADALARLHHGQELEVESAGSRPAGWVHPMAIRAMAELGVDISDAESKHADRFLDQPFDVVVTVCDSAAQDCPNWPGAKRMEHWPIEDPSSEFDPVTRYQRFVETRDDLARRIDELVASLTP
ncbi:MAG: arsenate reductase ArsC [Thermoanaerobaculia bacterium]